MGFINNQQHEFPVSAILYIKPIIGYSVCVCCVFLTSWKTSPEYGETPKSSRARPSTTASKQTNSGSQRDVSFMHPFYIHATSSYNMHEEMWSFHVIHKPSISCPVCAGEKNLSVAKPRATSSVQMKVLQLKKA